MKKADAIKNTFVNVLELPQDIVLDLPKITLFGNLQIYIENHKGIVEYTSTQIRIQTKVGILKITGENLLLKHIVKEEIAVVGEIGQIEFMD